MVVTIVVSLATARVKTDQDLSGLVYSLTPRLPEEREPWYKRPVILGVVVLAATLVLNLVFA
jgi:SSS family solute:Na+ symporter